MIKVCHGICRTLIGKGCVFTWLFSLCQYSSSNDIKTRKTSSDSHRLLETFLSNQTEIKNVVIAGSGLKEGVYTGNVTVAI